MNLEFKIIKTFLPNNNFIGDDCAYLKETNQLISTDTLVENKHFDLKYFSTQQIAHRLFLSNYSDIQSSGGTPNYALFNISFPKNRFKKALSISQNLKKTLFTHNIKMIGGDTTSSDKIILSLTLISKKILKSNVLLRSGAKIHDEIYIFKNIGYSKLGFLNIYNKLKLPTFIKNKSRTQFLKPQIYKYYDILNYLPVNSSMDLSDSLYVTLKEMAFQSKKRFIIENVDNINPILFEYFDNFEKYQKLILTSAEEYVPVFTLPKNFIDKKITSRLKSRGIEIVRIGSVAKGNGVKISNFQTNKINNFDHFNENYMNL